MRHQTLVLSVITILLLSAALSYDLPPPLNDEVLGLVVFKSSLQDPASSLSSWSATDTTPCSWLHVECDPATSRVVRLSLDSLSLSGPPLFRGLDKLQSLQSLSLSNNKLSGPLAPGLSLLPQLRVLDLSKNSLSGRLPDDLGSLSSLRSLDLSGNSLSEPIPESLFSSATCSTLRSLSLSDNHFEGHIPSALSQCRFLLHLNLSNNRLSGSPDFGSVIWPLSRLRILDLSNNSLSGPVAEGIATVHNLKSLHLNGNRFTGPIPVGIGLCPHLYRVDLGDNSFDGAVPYTMQSLFSLSFLSLSNNKLSGDVPAWIGNLGSLQHLDLSGNKLGGAVPDSFGGLKDLNYLSLSDNLLTGSVPESISECNKLKEIRLKENELNGSIPHSLFDLELELLDLSSNKLTGPVPAVSSKLAGTVRWLDLSKNELAGGIPAEMALYFNLKYLNLSWNGLRSQLPPELGSFRNLSVLDLRDNEFFGMIPGDLCESGSLLVLQLDGNSLTGPIPDEIGNCSSLYLLSLSHNQLSGTIPAAMSQLKKLEILNLEFNNLSGEIPQQLGTLENLLAVNISHNRLIGRLPMGGIFRSLDESSLEGNLGLCSPLVSEPCKMNVPKPLVLDPNAYINGDDNNMVSITQPMKSKHRRFFSVSTIVAISAALVIIFGVLVVSLLNVSARRRLGMLENALESICSSSTKSSGPAIGKTVLFGSRSSLRSEDLVSAESLLIKAVEIGKGAFGTVYKSSVGEGRIVAIKKLLTPNIIQHHDDFDREIRILAKARHPNIMPIKGYYWTPQLQLLISDYAPNGSLQARLHESTVPLPWASRFKVVLGVAKGLAYLHESFRPSIIHYNVKPSNILLDEDCNTKVSDFGLAKLLPRLDKHIMSSRFQTAMGYVAPELACQSLRINEKCDVYAYGVVVLELVTGLERRQLPEVDRNYLYQCSGYIDIDKIDKDAWPALVADLSAGEPGITALAFGFTRLFQPNKPVTKAQAAIALATGDSAEVVGEELTRIEAESLAETAVNAHTALVTQVEKELNASFEAELAREREKINLLEKLAEEARLELERLKAERAAENNNLVRGQAAVESEMEVLSRLRHEVEEQLQDLMSNKMEISFERDRINKLRKEAESQNQVIVQLQYELEVERKALSMARAWAEEEAKRAREQARVLEEARDRWERHGIKVVVDENLQEDASTGVTWLTAGQQPQVDETVNRGENLVEKLKAMAAEIKTKSSTVIERIIQWILSLITALKGLACKSSKRAIELQQSIVSKASTSIGELKDSASGFSSNISDKARRAVEDCKESVEKFSQKFKT